MSDEDLWRVPITDFYENCKLKGHIIASKKALNDFANKKLKLEPSFIKYEDGSLELMELSFVPNVDKNKNE